MPELAPTVAILVAPLLQVPPVVISANVVVAPTHVLAKPDIANGIGLTVIVDTALQPASV